MTGTSSVTALHQRDVLSCALGYIRLGWWVLPLLPGSKSPLSKLVPNGVHGATNDPTVARRWWTQCPDAGIGLALLKSLLVVVDEDPRNGGEHTIEALEAIHGPMVSDVMALTGGGGVHWVFTASLVGSLPGKLGPGVDLKADGYIVVEPSLHPSGKRYVWEASSDPLEGVLPAALPGWIRNLSVPVAAPGMGSGPQFITGSQQEELESALGVLPADDYHQWLQVGMALHGTQDRVWGFQVWDLWSQKSSKYDSSTMAHKWASFRAERLQTGVTYRSIFKWAQELGWQSPMMVGTKQEGSPPELSDAELAAMVREPPPQPPSRKAAAAIGPVSFPIDSLNALHTWFDRHGDSTHPLASQVGVLAVVCAAAARRYVSPSGDPASCYLGVLAPSLPMTRYVTEGIEKVLIDAGQSHALRTGRMTSPQHVYATLFREPASIYMPDDYGGQVRFSRRQPSGLMEQTLTLIAGRINSGTMLVLDNWQELGFSRAPEGGSGNPVIHAPSLSMFAAITAAHMPQIFKTGEFSRGLVDSLLLAPAMDGSQWRTSAARAKEPVPDAVVGRIRALRGTAEQDTATGGLGDLAVAIPAQRTVKFAGQVAEIERGWIELYAGQRAEVVQLAAGARRTLRRLCTALAAWVNPNDPVATKEIVSWAATFVKMCLDATIEQAHLRISDDDEKPDAYQRVLEFISQYGHAGVSIRDLTRGCRAYRSLKPDARTDLRIAMLEDESLVDFPSTSGRGRVLVASQFVENPNTGDKNDANGLEVSTCVDSVDNSVSTYRTA
jgi:hypothetical protein